jgi:hypothetical protein
MNGNNPPKAKREAGRNPDQHFPPGLNAILQSIAPAENVILLFCAFQTTFPISWISLA